MWGVWRDSRRDALLNDRRSFSVRMRDFQKLLVILPTSACAGRVPGVSRCAPSGRSPKRHVVYQALYAKGRGRWAARRLGWHALVGVLTNIFPETRIRREHDHHRRSQHALGSKRPPLLTAPAFPKRLSPQAAPPHPQDVLRIYQKCEVHSREELFRLLRR